MTLEYWRGYIFCHASVGAQGRCVDTNIPNVALKENLKLNLHGEHLQTLGDSLQSAHDNSRNQTLL